MAFNFYHGEPPMPFLVQSKRLLAFLAATSLLFGCVATQQPQYVEKAQAVTSKALEPVMLSSEVVLGPMFVGAKGGEELAGKYFSPASRAEFMGTIIKEINNTGRFTTIATNMTAGETYVVTPEIVSIEISSAAIPADPTRIKAKIVAKTKLSVSLNHQDSRAETSGIFEDTRTIEKRVSIKDDLEQWKASYVKAVVDLSFKAAADRLGNAFNPNYVYGAVSKLAGRIAYAQIPTGKIPKNQRAVEVVDGDNKVLATLEELVVEDGVISGKLYEKSATPIKVGAVVRARVD